MVLAIKGGVSWLQVTPLTRLPLPEQLVHGNRTHQQQRMRCETSESPDTGEGPGLDITKHGEYSENGHLLPVQLSFPDAS